MLGSLDLVHEEQRSEALRALLERLRRIGYSYTDFAIQQLTDLVHMVLPKVGKQVKAGEEFGEVESVKAVSSLYSPVSGEIVAVNADSRLDGLRVGMSLAAILAAVALFFTGKIPTVPPGRTATAAEPAAASP